jgi:hypothetical protein
MYFGCGLNSEMFKKDPIFLYGFLQVFENFWKFFGNFGGGAKPRLFQKKNPPKHSFFWEKTKKTRNFGQK